MKTRSLRFGIALTAAFVPGVVMAQHEAHQAGAPQPSDQIAPCAQVQPAIDNIIAAAMARLESARLANSAADMRAAVDNLEGALRDIHTQISRCAGTEATADPHAGHIMPSMQHPLGAPSAPMDHSNMPMGGAPASKPEAATRTKPAAPAAPMDHSKMPIGGDAKPAKVMDPVNGLLVDPATAPKTTYQGQTYYFSSEQSLKEFLEHPAKFAKKPEGEGT